MIALVSAQRTTDVALTWLPPPLCLPCLTALALTFSWKIGVVPGNIFAALLNDRLVAKGTVLEVMIVFFQVRAGAGRAAGWAGYRPVILPGGAVKHPGGWVA